MLCLAISNIKSYDLSDIVFDDIKTQDCVTMLCVDISDTRHCNHDNIVCGDIIH